MDEAGRVALQRWIEEKWKQGSCPVCEANQWQAGEDVLQLMPFHEGSLVVGGPVYPVLPIVCLNCGNSIFVSAVVAGIVKRPTVEPASEEKGDAPSPKEVLDKP